MKEATTALKLALEALEAADWYIDQLEMIVYCVDDEGTHENRAKVQAAITAIKEALAPTSTQCEVQDEPSSSQEPVGWQYREANDDGTWRAWIGCDKRLAEDHWRQVRAIYIAAPKEQQSCNKRPWVGLTATAKLDLLSTAKGVGGRINGDAQLLELLNEHETQLKRKNT